MKVQGGTSQTFGPTKEYGYKSRYYITTHRHVEFMEFYLAFIRITG